MSKTKTPAPSTAAIDSVLATLDAIETEQLVTVTGGIGGEGGESPASAGELSYVPHQIRN